MCRHDILAQIYYARRLAEKLHPVARMIELHAGHLVSHERTEEVHFSSIIDLITIKQLIGLWHVENLRQKDLNNRCLIIIIIVIISAS